MKNLFLSLCVIVSVAACDSYKADYVLNDTAICSGLDENSGSQVECKDKNGALITGRIAEYYDNGNTYRLFEVKNGMLDGSAKIFYENGNCKQDVFFRNGEAHGVAKTWHENGNLEIKDVEKNGVTYRTVYRDDGSIFFKMSFKNHKLNGVKKTYLNGQLLEEVDYTDGMPGLTRVYKDGKLTKVIEKDQDDDVQIEHEYNEYGIEVSKVKYKMFREIERTDTPREEIEKQCKKHINFCQGNKFEKGCKIVWDVKEDVVAKTGRGIQLDGFVDVVIKTNVDYDIGDFYSTNNYLEYVGTKNYVPIYDMQDTIQVYEFKETNMPICK